MPLIFFFLIAKSHKYSLFHKHKISKLHVFINVERLNHKHIFPNFSYEPKSFLEYKQIQMLFKFCFQIMVFFS